MVIADAFLLAI